MSEAPAVGPPRPRRDVGAEEARERAWEKQLTYICWTSQLGECVCVLRATEQIDSLRGICLCPQASSLLWCV